MTTPELSPLLPRGVIDPTVEQMAHLWHALVHEHAMAVTLAKFGVTEFPRELCPHELKN